MKKKATGLLLSLMLVVTLLGSGIPAYAEANTSPSASPKEVTTTRGQVTVSNFDELKVAVDQNQTNIVLGGGEYVFTSALNISGSVTITSAAKSVFVRGGSFSGDYMINVASSGSLKLGEKGKAIDLTFDGKNETSKGAILSEGYLEFNGAKVTNQKTEGSFSPVRLQGDKSQTVLNEGEISGNASGESAVQMSDGASLVMNGGKISKNATSNYYDAGGVSLKSGAKMKMTGGEISGNSGGIGGVTVGRILMYDLFDYNNNMYRRPNLTEQDLLNIAGRKSSFEMTGGTISGNKGSYFCGGLMVNGNAGFTMDGGLIDGNESQGDGGGVYVTDWLMFNYAGRPETINDPAPAVSKDRWFEIFPASFTMNGGTISNNKAIGNYGDGDGGGILVKSHNVHLKKGTITGNSAKTHGGGIHLKTVPYDLVLETALVRDNTSKNEGGGIWICPIGDFEFQLEDGALAYRNTAKNAGDDFFSREKHKDYFTPSQTSHYAISLPTRMLNGFPIAWYSDEANARYKAGDTAADPSFYNDKAFGLKAIMDYAKADIAADKTDLKIYGNTAGDGGGGIGSNGHLQIGKKPVEGNPVKNFVMTKTWDGVKAHDVKVEAYLGKTLVGTFDLTKDNKYTATIKDLPSEVDGTPIEDLLKFNEIGTETYEVFSVGKMTEGELQEKDIASADGTAMHTVKFKDFQVPLANVVKKADVKVTKTWKVPEGVTVPDVEIQLYKGDKDNKTAVGDPVTLKSGTKEYTFKDLPVAEKDGTKINYFAEEVKVPADYVAEKSDDPLVLVNRYAPKTEISGTKTWTGSKKDHPAVKVALYRVKGDGSKEQVGDAVTLKAGTDMTQKYSWKDIPVYDKDLNKIKYEVKEVSVPKGYTMTQDGYDITNKYIESNKPATVDTGDDSSIPVYATILALAVAAAAALAGRRRKI